MNILIACEFSGRVREAFKARGHNAWSIDIEPSEIPGQHIREDCILYLQGMYLCPECGLYDNRWVTFHEFHISHCFNNNHCKRHIGYDENGEYWMNWDMLIAFPPCTYLSSVGNRWMKNNPQRQQKREEAFDFFMKTINAPVPKICVENPLGYVNSHYRPADQTVHPYYFGDNELKRTCLWLKGLPLLTHLDPKTLKKPEPKYLSLGEKTKGKRIYYTESLSEGSRDRSRTFPGIARAMAEQWG